MKQKDVVRTMGWAGAAAGAALAVGYFLQTGNGAKRWKSLSRGVRGLMDSAGGELGKLGRDMGILDARKTSHTTRSSRSLAGSSDAASEGSSSEKKSRGSGSRSSLKKSSGGKRSKKSA